MQLSKKILVDGIAHLLANEKRLRQYKVELEKIRFKKRKFEFSTFVSVVVNQQLSDKASDTIRRRIY